MKKKSRSIQTKLLFLIIFITMIQTALFLGFVVFGGFAKRLKENAVVSMSENTKNNRLNLEKELLHRWIYTLDGTETLTKQIEGVVKRQGRTIEDIKKDPQLNMEISRGVADTLINMLHSSAGNGVFIILDGPVAEKAENLKAGLYFRDLDASSRAQDNSDLLLERGLPAVSKELGIALDSYWEIGFPGDSAFPPYDMPVREALKNDAQQREASNFGYLSHPFAVNPLDVEVITYSMPLIMPDQTVIGVVGFDITLPQLEKILVDMEPEYDGRIINLLGFRKNGSDDVEIIAAGGGGYEWYFRNAPVITCEKDKNQDIRWTSDNSGNKWYACLEKLKVYGNNTPFEDDELVLVRMRPQKEVLSFYAEIRDMFAGFVIACVFLSLAGGILVGRRVSMPIRQMISEMRDKQLTRNVHGLTLTRPGISEIDEMGETIEMLSAEVEKASSKISHILELTEVPIGVYEYVDDETPVFCSRTLFSMLGWGEIEPDYVYMPPEKFKSRMEDLEHHLWSTTPRIFYLETPKPCWVKLLTVENRNGKGILGVCLDETASVLEKKKLEWERNYDLLTGIYNRRAFKEEAERIIARSQLKQFAVIMWDLDNLKYMNDTFGHDEGDRYIAAFANELRRLEQGGGLISRYSGDEFVTLLFDKEGKEGIRRRLSEFMRELREDITITIGDQSMPLRVSSGLAWYPDDATEFTTLVHYADFAMYMVKHSVKGVLQEFDKKIYENNYYMLEGKEELNRLLEEKLVKFAFQPIVDRKGHIYGYELLMRPQTEKIKGVDEVLRLAKEQAKIRQIERLTWEESFRQIDKKIKDGSLDQESKLFINSVANAALSEIEIDMLEKTYPELVSRIVMEITESEPLSTDSMNFKRTYISKWNARIAIDDFGTGYNSESIFLQIQPDIVKIDMHLIRGIDSDVNRQMLVRNIMTYTKQTDIKVLAEGVETEEELKVLMAFGVDLFQGYFIGYPDLKIVPIPPEKVKKIEELGKTFQKREEN